MAVTELKKANVALLAKLLWKLVAQPEAISSKVLAAKYGGWSAISRNLPVRNTSYVWRSLVYASTWFKRGLRWDVQNGSKVLFWWDSWLLEKPLIKFATMELPADQGRLTVRQLWQPGIGWNLHILLRQLPTQIIALLNQHPLQETTPRYGRKVATVSSRLILASN